MMKANEKQVRYCVAPVLMALGLWLTGNALLGMQSARGQEVAGNFKTPIPAPYYGNVTNMCTRSDSCTRLYEDVWGCKPAGFFDSCHDNVNRSVAVYSQKTICTAIDPGGLVCDWNAANGNIVSTRLPDACEYSSKATGTGHCLEASSPKPQHEWKVVRSLQLA